VYRYGELVNEKPMAPFVTFFIDKESGTFSYSVSAKGPAGTESPRSIPVTCTSGTADTSPPLIILVSPPASSPVDQAVWIKARLVDNRSYEEISAKLRYRAPGEKQWKTVEMDRKVKAIFAAEIPAREVTQLGLEYYIEASDGTNSSLFPPSAPEVLLSVVTTSMTRPKELPSPAAPGVKDQRLTWSSTSMEAFWYRIYRSNRPDFKAGPANFVTYVAAGTTGFKDNGEGFDGMALKGDWYYRVTAVSRFGIESPPSPALKVTY
jgi:hypothetical protein